MRLLLSVLVLPWLVLQAHAQSGPAQPSVPGGTVPAANAPAPATTEHHRMTWQQRFEHANLAHDGHLTMQEASGGYASVARHFKEIDAEKKGYVTEEDVATWHKLQRAMHRSARGKTEDGLRPRPAFDRTLPEPRQMNTSTEGTMLPMAQPDAPAGQQATVK